MTKTPASSVARQLFRARRWADAERVARSAARDEAGFGVEAAAISGFSALRLGRPADAIRALRHACNGTPGAPALWLALAEANIALGEDFEAAEALTTAAGAGAAPSELAELRGALRRATRELPSSDAWGALARGQSTTPGQWEASIQGLLRARMPEHAFQLLTERPPGTSPQQVRVIAGQVAAQRLDVATTVSEYRAVLNEDIGYAEEAFVAMLGVGAFEAAEWCAELEERATGEPRCRARLATYRGDYVGAWYHAARVSSPVLRSSIEAALALAEGRVDEARGRLAVRPRNAAEDVLYLEALCRLGRIDEATDQFERLDSHALPDVAAAPLVLLTYRSLAKRMRLEDHRHVAVLREDFPDLGRGEDPVAFTRAAVDALSGNWTRCATRLVAPGTLRAQTISRPVRMRVAGLRQAMSAVPLPTVVALHDALETDVGRHPLIDTYRAEFELWRGDYDAAETGFRRALEFDVETRWAYVGVATCQLLRGAPELVAETFREQLKWLAPMPNGRACVAEAQLRLGHVEEAEATYHEALTAHPTRTSAWLGLGLVASLRGVPAGVGEAMERVRALVPTFFRQWQRDVGHLAPHGQLERALAMMRGNRNSQLVTWWTADGAFHGEYVSDGA